VILNGNVITIGHGSYFSPFLKPLWLTHDFTGNNIPGLGVAPEVKDAQMTGYALWRLSFSYCAGNC
jgi:hypothetical protein